MINNPLPNLEDDPELKKELLKFCRLKGGERWTDGKHVIICDDATNVIVDRKFQLAIHDPPYNLVFFDVKNTFDYIEWCRKWMKITESYLDDNSSLYVWLGADQRNGFQPLPEFMMLMREFKCFQSRSLITMRNQRGYGTQKNWMSIRQELLYYTKGKPYFEVQYTEIPKVVKGYYKVIDGELTENLKRSNSNYIRSGNVWIDIQQIFYRMDENVSGCFAQKPLKAIERIIKASSKPNDSVLDLFGHSGTTLLACEKLNRTCVIVEKDPVYCEIMIRRLEHYRKTGLTGWQNGNCFSER